MSISKDIFLAILSLDSYNRGYGAGLAGLSERSDNPEQVGLATIYRNLADFGLDGDAEASGFYAIAYDTPYGTVISYRGTDNQSLFFNDVTGGGDIYKGWVTGGGAWQTDQVRLAQEFFQFVTGTVDQDLRNGTAILTGHSLGGGLAGFIASLHGKEAVVFDNMPFELASDNAQASADPNTSFGIVFQEYAQDTFYNGDEPWEIDRSGISGAYVTGEVLQYLRAYQETELNSLDPHTEQAGMGQLHSQALLVMLMFADDAKTVDWHPVAGTWLDALFDDKVGKAAGFAPENTDGRYTEAEKLMAAIAYSALEGDEGLVFGDSGIRAMFDDLGQLGAVMSAANRHSTP